MREIKFRAWYEGAGMLHKDKVGDVFRWINEGQPIKIMQYTGLKDRNGKEIYEGDVCRFDAVVWKIYFMDACFWAQSDTREMELYQIHPHEIEIIGNIYENPNYWRTNERTS